jgi:hypothetical protein
MISGAWGMSTDGGGKDKLTRQEQKGRLAAASHAIRSFDLCPGFLRFVERSSTRTGARSARPETSADSAGKRRRIVCKSLNQFDHFGPLRGRKLDEGFQEPQPLNGVAGRIAELLAQFRS